MDFSHTFKKQRSYQKYHKDKKLVGEILTFFAEHDESTYTLSELSKKTNIPHYQLSRWRSKWKEDNNYKPGERIGKHKRLFTQEQEKHVADLLRIQYINPGIMVRRKHLKSVLFSIWQSFDLENRGHLPKRLFSNHFLKDFCKRNKFSFRKMRKKKRSDIDEKEVDLFVNEYAEAFASYPWYLILNADETPWNFVYYRGEVLAITGKEEVDAQLPDDYRKSFSVLATIGADGKKYPPLFIAKGKTSASERQFDNMKSEPERYSVYHSEGGNTDEGVMIYYLHQVHKWVDKAPCALILDRYPSHETETVQEEARKLGIKLIYVPTSATELYQPLDRRVFGALKSKASSKFNDHAFTNQTAYSKAEAADLFIQCWNELNPDVILSAFRLCENEEEDETDADFEPFDDNSEEEEDVGDIDSDDLFVISDARREERRAKVRLTPPRPL